MPRVLRLQSQAALKLDPPYRFDLGCIRCVAFLDRTPRGWWTPGGPRLRDWHHSKRVTAGVEGA